MGNLTFTRHWQEKAIPFCWCVFLFYSIVSVKEVTWKNTLLILNIGGCAAVSNSLLKHHIKCLGWKVRFASENEHITFKIQRRSKAPEIKPLGQISSPRHSSCLELVLLFQSYTGVNETIIISLFFFLNSFIEDRNTREEVLFSAMPA